VAICDDENTETKELVDKHLKQEDILSDFEEEAMLFMTMQENKDKKSACQRIRAQVI
jgi:hypothetical protein